MEFKEKKRLRSHFFHACKFGDHQFIQQQIDNGNIKWLVKEFDEYDSHNRDGLTWAASGGQWNTVDLLLEHGARLGYSHAILFLLAHVGRKDLIDMLLNEHGEDIATWKNDTGQCLLQIVFCSWGRIRFEIENFRLIFSHPKTNFNLNKTVNQSSLLNEVSSKWIAPEEKQVLMKFLVDRGALLSSSEEVLVGRERGHFLIQLFSRVRNDITHSVHK
eukprot:TRINITY_DN1452_c0_g1_i1.p1 TRINITY_DN1452_c0_g1~~TRINITY_DN1452_c0_g1_i1.p1  ORF type:complete len:217 (-),score=27.51 TRINITY_DN1452_c0_g1_i1:230-880(-)